MTESGPSPVAWVQVMQALVARELVEGFGLPERQAARLLGIVPSSVSQYLSGKRLGPMIGRFLGSEEARRVARRSAQELLEGHGDPKVVLEAAVLLSHRFGPRHHLPKKGTGPSDGKAVGREVPRWLRHRIAGEQNAVAECMRLAQKSRDELTRALFRQIASDSLRHAEIVASLAAYLDRGISSSVPTGITRGDIQDLVRKEHEAEASLEGDPGPDLGGVMRILWQSMEADERKHELLLEALLAADSGMTERPRGGG